MIEKIILDYLTSALDVSVYTEISDDEPTRYVVLEKTGESCENHIHSATVAIQSYAESRFEAAELNKKVKKAMDEIVFLNSIGKSKLNTDYNFPDTTKKKHRYQAVYDVIY